MILHPFAFTLVLGSLLDPVYDQASAILDVVALAAIFGSFLAYSRVKAALIASEASAKAWHEERDAEKARAERTAYDLKMSEDEKLKLLATVASLESRPDLSRLEDLMSESTASIKRHEIAAAERSERLIAAVQSIPRAV